MIQSKHNIQNIEFAGFSKYDYDTTDNLISIRDTYGNEFNFTYDSLGRKIKLKDSDLGTWTYRYGL